eukprot:TRINITY_DN4799_c0_g1_i1.p1 TRINITY_DN4799_c0_g1~~TRINITY_DN4799_c0_g1_i1.p1  ORF type:complete len:984 (+),score=53.63 TRINITY_DN4799_c0_g1_i1:45-2996(+)
MPGGHGALCALYWATLLLLLTGSSVGLAVAPGTVVGSFGTVVDASEDTSAKNYVSLCHYPIGNDVLVYGRLASSSALTGFRIYPNGGFQNAMSLLPVRASVTSLIASNACVVVGMGPNGFDVYSATDMTLSTSVNETIHIRGLAMNAGDSSTLWISDRYEHVIKFSLNENCTATELARQRFGDDFGSTQCNPRGLVQLGSISWVVCAGENATVRAVDTSSVPFNETEEVLLSDNATSSSPALLQWPDAPSYIAVLSKTRMTVLSSAAPPVSIRTLSFVAMDEPTAAVAVPGTDHLAVICANNGLFVVSFCDPTNVTIVDQSSAFMCKSIDLIDLEGNVLIVSSTNNIFTISLTIRTPCTLETTTASTTTTLETTTASTTTTHETSSSAGSTSTTSEMMWTIPTANTTVSEMSSTTSNPSTTTTSETISSTASTTSTPPSTGTMTGPSRTSPGATSEAHTSQPSSSTSTLAVAATSALTTTSTSTSANGTSAAVPPPTSSAAHWIAPIAAAVVAVVAAPAAGRYLIVAQLWALTEPDGGPPLLLSPLQWTVGGSAAIGTVLGNLCLALSAAVLGFLFAAARQMVTSGAWSGLAGATSWGLWAYQVLHIGTAWAAVALIVEGGAVGVAIGAAGCLACVVVPTAAVYSALHNVPLVANVREDIRVHAPAALWMIGRGEWASTSRDNYYVERWCFILRPYTAKAAWFSGVDFAASFGVAAVHACQSRFGARPTGFAIGAILAGVLAAELWHRPHARPHHTACSAVLSAALAAACFMAAAAGPEAVPLWLQQCCMALLLLWATCAVVTEAWVQLSRRRHRLQLEAYAHTEWREELARENMADLFAGTCMALGTIDTHGQESSAETSSNQTTSLGIVPPSFSNQVLVDQSVLNSLRGSPLSGGNCLSSVQLPRFQSQSPRGLDASPPRRASVNRRLLTNATGSDSPPSPHPLLPSGEVTPPGADGSNAQLLYTSITPKAQAKPKRLASL